MNAVSAPASTLRPAVPADVPALAALEERLFATDAWTADTLATDLAAPGRWWCVAEQDGVVVGYAAVAVAGDVADLLRIGVDPAVRRTGVASLFLDAALAAARERGANRLLLEVSEANRGAVAFYVARGFTQIDARPAYYRDRSAALVLRRGLGPACGGRTP
ncbi:MAG: ribosomal protein S18-alanine N-acetyltransferase [Nocardioides sp.]|nr:ribosomal protein S18-alanine N-acetyltransferase [Nocardioides sp.]